MLDVFNVQDAKTAKVFSNSSQRQMLLQLVVQERSLQCLATMLRMPLSLAYYHVGRLRALSLIEIARREPRAGRAVKLYRALAKSFFVPARLLSRSPSDKLSTELRAALERGRSRASGSGGTMYYVDGRSMPRMRPVEGRYAQVAFEAWRILEITDRDARELAKQMSALLSRYERLHSAGTRVYLAHCAVVRREPRNRRG